MNAKIGLEDVRFHAPHGFYEEEHRSGNEFSIDVEVESDIHGAATQDDLGGTVNYSTIYYLLQAEMKKPTQLLEALAFRMANRIQNQFPQVTSVKLRLRKLNPPLGGQVGAAVVEVNLGSSAGGGGNMPGVSGMGSGMGSSSTFDEGGFGGGGGGGFGGGYSPGPFAGGKPAPAFAPQDDEEDYGEFEDEDEGFELDFDAIDDDDDDEMEGDFTEGAEGEGYDYEGDFEDDGEGYEYDDD
jgi:dihydroneopterin aldolase